MLQQTTVKTVIPYYLKFLRRFPSIKSLATAQEDDVLAAWSGLGYYSRARNLQRTAQACHEQYRGQIPRDVVSLKQLPGIGAYTAGAIASIAYDQRAALVDGNVARVLSRLFRIGDDPKTTSGQRRFWKQADAVLPKSHCGDFNQALMELGATICTPTRPLCSLCPVHINCQATLEGDTAKFPNIKTKVAYRSVRLTSALIWDKQGFLMVRRPNQGVLKALWEFPTIEGELEALLQAYNLKLKAGTPLQTIRHSIMNQRITVSPWLFRPKQARSLIPPQGSRWVSSPDIAHLPTSSMVQKLLKSAGKVLAT